MSVHLGERWGSFWRSVTTVLMGTAMAQAIPLLGSLLGGLSRNPSLEPDAISCEGTAVFRCCHCRPIRYTCALAAVDQFLVGLWALWLQQSGLAINAYARYFHYSITSPKYYS